jgi:hypothetical protein
MPTSRRYQFVGEVKKSGDERHQRAKTNVRRHVESPKISLRACLGCRDEWQGGVEFEYGLNIAAHKARPLESMEKERPEPFEFNDALV